MIYSEDIAIKSLKNSDNGAFIWIYNTYNRSLCLYAEKILRQSQLAEDIVQSFFLTLWEKREHINIQSSLKSYLYRSIHNNCLQHLEHTRVVRSHVNYFQSIYKNGEPTHADNNPLFILMFKKMKSKTEKTIKNLPEQRRVILLLRINEQLSYQEIAQKLGVTGGTVKKQINRAMSSIKESLEIKSIKK